jgi:hypothetical protein
LSTRYAAKIPTQPCLLHRRAKSFKKYVQSPIFILTVSFCIQHGHFYKTPTNAKSSKIHRQTLRLQQRHIFLIAEKTYLVRFSFQKFDEFSYTFLPYKPTARINGNLSKNDNPPQKTTARLFSSISAWLKDSTHTAFIKQSKSLILSVKTSRLYNLNHTAPLSDPTLAPGQWVSSYRPP